MHFRRSFALALPALCLLVAVSGGARAGIENQEIGEQCWGGDCSDMTEADRPEADPREAAPGSPTSRPTTAARSRRTRSNSRSNG